jgi:hypothetical protein
VENAPASLIETIAMAAVEDRTRHVATPPQRSAAPEFAIAAGTSGLMAAVMPAASRPRVKVLRLTALFPAMRDRLFVSLFFTLGLLGSRACAVTMATESS